MFHVKHHAGSTAIRTERNKMIDTILRILVLTIPFIVLGLTIVQVIWCYKDDLEHEKIYLTRQYIINEECSWEELELDPPNNTYECAMAIIDDATCNGFEFKVDNGKIYFREVEQ